MPPPIAPAPMITYLVTVENPNPAANYSNVPQLLRSRRPVQLPSTHSG